MASHSRLGRLKYIFLDHFGTWMSKTRLGVLQWWQNMEKGVYWYDVLEYIPNEDIILSLKKHRIPDITRNSSSILKWKADQHKLKRMILNYLGYSPRLYRWIFSVFSENIVCLVSIKHEADKVSLNNWLKQLCGKETAIPNWELVEI